MGGHSQDGAFLDLLRKGNAAYQAGRYEDAAREYRAAAELSPSSVPARSNLGRTLAKLGRFEEALPELEGALKLNPEHGPSLFYLAFCLERQRQWERAVLGYEKFLLTSVASAPEHAERARFRIREIRREHPSLPLGGGPSPNVSRDPASPAPGVSPAADSQAWRAGQVVDGLYEIEDLLGEGGFGSVHRVRHLGWRMRMAVKSPREDRLSDPRAAERFVREANTWVGLGLHPNIVTCHFVRLIGGVPRIFMEYAEAGNLREWLAQRKGVEVREALDVAIQLARAMERVQYRGVVHRDLKPENCLMSPDGVLKVTDFGLAKSGAGERLSAGEPGGGDRGLGRGGCASAVYRLGTVMYMAPEQWINAGEATSSADIWTFGVMLYELLHGERPYRKLEAGPPEAMCDRMRKANWEYAFRPDFPSRLKSVVSSCLTVDPAKRESEFRALREKLEALYAEMFKEPYPRPQIKQTPPLADTLSNQGVSLADLGRHEEALKLFNAALAQDPTHPGATYNAGILLLAKGELTTAELAARLDGCKRARAWEWEPEFLRRLVRLRDKGQEAAVKELKEAVRVWDNPLVRRALAFAEAGRHRAALEPFVSPPTGAESAMAEDGRFNELLAQVRTQADSGHYGRANGTLLLARDLRGYERAPLALALQARLGRYGTRMGLRAAWLKTAFADSGKCLCAAISPDGRQALSGHEDGTVRLWELETGRSLKAMGRHGGPVWSLGFFSDATAALSGGGDGSVMIWDLVSGECVRTLKGHAGAVRSVCVNPDERHALSAGEDGKLVLWDLKDGSLRRSGPSHKGAVRALALTKGAGRAVTIGAEGQLKQWDIFNGAALGAPLDVGPAHALALSPDGRSAMVAGIGEVAEWDLRRRVRLRAAGQKGQGGALKTLDWTADRRFLVAGGDDPVTRLWDLSSQTHALQPVWAFEGRRESTVFAGFSPDGRWVLLAGRGGLRLWELDWEFSFPEAIEGLPKEAPPAKKARPGARILAAAGLFLAAACGWWGYRTSAFPGTGIPGAPSPGAAQGDSIGGMVLIPAGQFQADQSRGEAPPGGGAGRKVYLDSYYIDKNEVTVGQYRKFLRAAGRLKEDPSGGAPEDMPITGVDWNQASVYCLWAGKRLPTEAEWEKAARGSDGRIYPWGNEWDRNRSNSASLWAGRDVVSPSEVKAWKGELSKGAAARTPGPMPVGSFPLGSSPYGVLDMAGNVTEWVAESHDKGDEDSRVLRGGSYDSGAVSVRATTRYRAPGGARFRQCGFRCAGRTAPGPSR